ncbi:MAG: outer membrane lipoprotein chaperone LolA [bacterium]
MKQITERMQKRYDALQDATAKFQQHVKFGFSNIEQDFSGVLMMKRPNNYRVESEHQTIVTDGKTVWSYSPVNKQVLIDTYKENQNSLSPENFLLNLPSNFYATLLGAEAINREKVYTLKLVPKDDRSFIKSLKVWVEDGVWTVRKVIVLDVNDTETTYTVADLKQNIGLSASTFSFKPPQGTEVVDLR